LDENSFVYRGTRSFLFKYVETSNLGFLLYNRLYIYIYIYIYTYKYIYLYLSIYIERDIERAIGTGNDIQIDI